jgi:hypothetical protein
MVVLVAGVGLLAAGIRPREPLPPWRRRVVWLFAAMVLLAWLATIVRFEIDRSGYVPRGRYLHLAIIPTVWLLMCGIERLAPERWRRQSLFALTLFFALLDVTAWSVALSTTFYR